MRNRNFYFIIFFLFLSAWIILGTLSGNAENDEQTIREVGQLPEGKNIIFIEYPIYASELITLNPEIEYVSFHDEFLNRQISYVNVFGGVGQNFLLVPEIEYEVYSKNQITLKTR